METGCIERVLKQRLGFAIANTAEIDPGVPHNNRLLHLWSTDGRQAVAKIYFDDDRQRLDREYTSLAFLHTLGASTVATPYLRDDATRLGIYSYEAGVTPTSAELTTRHMEDLADFAARLRGIRPGTPGAIFHNSTSATFSLQDQVGGIRGRLAQFELFATSPTAFDAVRHLRREVDVAGSIERLIGRALDGLSAEAIEARVAEHDRSLTSGDLAPHNLLIRPDNSICVLDFEYSGWDDPAIPIADFLAHDRSRDLSAACARALSETYAELAGLASLELERMRRVRALMEVGWLAVHRPLLVPARFAAKQFADPNFQVEAHLARHVARFCDRLKTADHTLDQLVGPSGGLA
jgi:hypothetical protein